MPHNLMLVLAAALSCLAAGGRPVFAAPPPASEEPHAAAVRLAIEDLMASFGAAYPDGPRFLARLQELEPALAARDEAARAALRQLRQDALLANPLLDFDRLALLRRQRGQLGLPTNHQCNTCLPQNGYDNEIAILSPVKAGRLTTLFRPNGGLYVGEIDVDFDAQRLLFTMPNGRTWQIHEIGVDGGGLRQVWRETPDVDNFDACYLPDGRIVFASTAYFTGVPCWHGRERACCLYQMNADGSRVRQLCFDQDHDLHPSVLSNGQVVFSRWDYTGIMHLYLRPLMAMNPDGTLQRALYGSNSYYPNSLYFPRAVPNAPTKLVAILSGYHGPNRMGDLVVLDLAKGWHEARGIAQRVGHRGEPIQPVIRDNLIGDNWPKFLHPYPLSEKYFLVAAQVRAKAPWGIYLADVFDNLVPLVKHAAYDYFEPIPLKPRAKPPVIPDRVDLARDDATVFLHDVYAGPGLAGVPRGAVKRLRVAAYHYGFPGMAGPDKIGRSGPWEVVRILGTVPVHEDGSAAFRVPACTPISVQPLDADGMALALMRSWYTAMPGEQASCVGCHERPNDVPATRGDQAARQAPVEIEPWYGPPRGFDFAREVQPVLDKYCVGCHDGRPHADRILAPDLRDERCFPAYEGLPLSQLGASRLEPILREQPQWFAPYQPEHKLIGDRKTRYTPAYEALIPYIRRVNIEDHVGLHVPCEYHADTSELVQLLRKGHCGVRLDQEAWDRLITWIDLNGPCHGSWNDVAPIPRRADQRRWDLAREFHGAPANAEDERLLPAARLGPPVSPAGRARASTIAASPPPGWPLPESQARQRQRAHPPWRKTLDLGAGVPLELVRIPAGACVMGSVTGDDDESPQTVATVANDFWMSACEITNEQFRRFAPAHFSGYFSKRSLSPNGPGVAMDNPRQPVVRVSWEESRAFCQWLSQRTGAAFSLPTELQWEYACRAGSDADLSYGQRDADFSSFGNMADAALGRIYDVTGGVVLLQELLRDARCDDGAIATADVGGYAPNAWGLHDMHGNAAEWTLSAYAPYPYAEDGRNEPDAVGRRVVRGGSFFDRPPRCRSAFRWSYPSWQRVHNVGFRVVAAVEAR